MFYALLCYNDEATVWSLDKKQDNEVMDRLAVVRGRLEKQGKLGPSLRLLPTTAATTLRKSDPPLVIDGPFAIIDVADLDEALGVARELGEANPGGAYEIRPLAVYNAGVPLGADAAA